MMPTEIAQDVAKNILDDKDIACHKYNNTCNKRSRAWLGYTLEIGIETLKIGFGRASETPRLLYCKLGPLPVTSSHSMAESSVLED